MYLKEAVPSAFVMVSDATDDQVVRSGERFHAVALLARAFERHRRNRPGCRRRWLMSVRSTRVSVCFTGTLWNSCTRPEGHSTRRVSMTVASPEPDHRVEAVERNPILIAPDLPHLPDDPLPPILALTRTLAPMAERLESVPTHRTLIQLLAFPLLR